MSLPIPGIFPPPIVPKTAGIRVSPLGGLRHIFCTDSPDVKRQFSMVIRDLDGKELLRDDRGLRVFKQVENRMANYYVITDPKQDYLPLGSLWLHILIDRQRELQLPLTVAADVFHEEGPNPVVRTGINEVGSFYLNEGQKSYVHDFPCRFIKRPRVVLVQVFADPSLENPLDLGAVVNGIDEYRFSINLQVAPNTGRYQLSWVAWA